jgi:Spy/CpxP family protein refolding chaperone
MKRIHYATLLSITFAVALTFFAAPALALDKPADMMQIVREKIKADKKLLIAENMQLTESQAKAFWPVYEDYQKELGELGSRVVKMIEGYAANYDTMTDAAAKEMLNDYMETEKDRLKLMQSYLPKFSKVLPDKKVARYFQIENKIRAVVNYELAKIIPLVP